MTHARIGELEFLRKLQRLLAEGDFVATYKFALLFIEYYWPQARPYRALEGTGQVLLQSTGRQAAVINQVAAAQVAHATLPAARAATLRWHTLVTRVAGTIETMPLLSAQRVLALPRAEREKLMEALMETTVPADIPLLPRDFIDRSQPR